MKEGALVPPFRIGPFADRVFRGSATMVRDNYQARPVRGWIRFTGQRVLARSAQLVFGRPRYYREEAKKRCQDVKYQYHEGCQTCSVRDICDGFHGDYADLHGTAEAQPVNPEGAAVTDPLHYIRRQEKIVESEDRSWAL